MTEILNVSVGKPKEVMLSGRPVLTSIFKSPVEGDVKATFQNLEGDRQADLSVHGGRDKAIYIYSHDYYADWAKLLKRDSLEAAQFGENLTVRGLVDEDVVVGDKYRIGGVIVTVTQPRIPCFKLGLRLSDQLAPKLFWETGKLGFYVRVEQEGFLKRGDGITQIERPDHNITLRSLWETVTQGNPQRAGHALGALQHLDDGWIRRLTKLATNGI